MISVIFRSLTSAAFQNTTPTEFHTSMKLSALQLLVPGTEIKGLPVASWVKYAMVDRIEEIEIDFSTDADKMIQSVVVLLRVG